MTGSRISERLAPQAAVVIEGQNNAGRYRAWQNRRRVSALAGDAGYGLRKYQAQCPSSDPAISRVQGNVNHAVERIRYSGIDRVHCYIQKRDFSRRNICNYRGGLPASSLSLLGGADYAERRVVCAGLQPRRIYGREHGQRVRGLGCLRPRPFRWNKQKRPAAKNLRPPAYMGRLFFLLSSFWSRDRLVDRYCRPVPESYFFLAGAAGRTSRVTLLPEEFPRFDMGEGACFAFSIMCITVDPGFVFWGGRSPFVISTLLRRHFDNDAAFANESTRGKISPSFLTPADEGEFPHG